MSVKKWLVLVTTFLFFQGLAQAEVLITTVFNVIESKKSERILVLSGRDGRVYKQTKTENNLKQLKRLIGSVVSINYTVRGTESIITKIERVNPSLVAAEEMELNYFRYHQLREFAPSDLQSQETLTSVFDSMLNDGDRSRSQCFKRAHMWAYDMWSKLGISSQKIFIFYTERYRFLEKSEWWFHVAPMVVANGEEWVFDGTFMEEPKTLKDWTAHFIKTDKITCPVVEKFQKFEDNQWNRLCYLMKVPMFYFSPLDIQARDKNGTERNHWVLDELQDARRAFRDYDKTYEALDTGKPTTTY